MKKINSGQWIGGKDQNGKFSWTGNELTVFPMAFPSIGSRQSEMADRALVEPSDPALGHGKGNPSSDRGGHRG